MHPAAQPLLPKRNAVFHDDDDASIYTARIVKEWLEERSKEVKHLLWPI